MLRPPQAQVADVAYWVNKELERRGQAAQLACVNTAVEESTLADRAGERMLAQVHACTAHLHLHAHALLVGPARSSSSHDTTTSRSRSAHTLHTEQHATCH